MSIFITLYAIVVSANLSLEPVELSSTEEVTGTTVRLEAIDHAAPVPDRSAAGRSQSFAHGKDQKRLLDAGFETGFGLGHKAYGSAEAHDMALAKLRVGIDVDDLCGYRWCRGGWQLAGELLVGEQIHPKGAYLVGLTPVLRYNFATESPWVPFLDGGAGVTLTDIGRPDLSTHFQFNTQFGLGVRRWLTAKTSLEFQYRFMHLSNAGSKEPNRGVNTSLFFVGVASRF